MSYLDTPIIYNLFPRLAGRADRWPRHAERAAAMGFNWLYLNPVHYPGFSGSLYAIKDHGRLHPDFVPEGSADDTVERLAPVLREIVDLGLYPIADLVVNHTARDSPLVAEHPDWYVRDDNGNVASPFAVDPDDPTKVTTWGDLAEIDNHGSPDREALWGFWARLVERYLELGFQGFRCDAAYKVPAELWRRLVEVAKRSQPHARFFAETLGCTLEQARAVKDSGLDFFFNSSKWWDFEAPWCLEQHREFADIPSISFPESHDTQRLATESDGSEVVQRQRYAFAAVFSAGLMMPVGYEFGFRRKPDVVRTTPQDWEAPSFDLTSFVRRVNGLKASTPVLQGEGSLELVSTGVAEALVLERRTVAAPGQVAWIAVNKRAERSVRLPTGWLPRDMNESLLVRLGRDGAGGERRAVPDELLLEPAEVALVLPATG